MGISFENDLLRRKETACNLIKILEHNSEIRVLAIDSEWGTGKTTFIKMWINMLKNDEEYKKKYETIYFNSWENDYISEPLVCLLTELDKAIKDKEGKVKSLLASTKEKGKAVISIGAEIALKMITKGAMDLTDFSNITEEGIIELSEKLGNTMIENIKNTRKTRESLKDALVTFQKQVDKKVIVFIDELDRCRPTFSIELLETIKHIFNIENYIFVISLDKEQLGHSIKTLYGQGMDSNGYLKRFFDLEYILPNVEFKRYIKAKNKVLSEKYENTIYFEQFLEDIFIMEGYSLRDVDKAYNYIKLLMPNIDLFYTNKNWKKVYLLAFSYMYAYFINLRIKRNELLKKVKNFDYNKENIVKFEFIDINKLRCDFQGISKERVQEVLSNVISKYLEFLLEKNISENGSIYLKDEEEDKFRIGLKRNNVWVSCDYYFDFNNIKEERINLLEKLDFISGFVVD